MKKYYGFFILLISILMLFTASSLSADTRGISVKPVSPSGEQVAGDQWLFVIGIDTYIEWPRLETAVNDAK